MSRAEVLHWTPTDYLSDYKTRRLDLQEHGAYMLLLWHMWNNSDSQCEFPLDYRALASIWGVSADEAMRLIESLQEPGVTLIKTIERKSGPVLQSKRLREQATAFQIARQKNAKAGRQSGVIRRANAANICSTGVEHMLNESEPTVVPYLGSPGLPVTRKTPVSSRSSGPQRTERGSYPQGVKSTTEYLSGKLDGRKLTPDESASVARWVKDYGADVCQLGIGYAARDGFLDDPKRVCGQIKALAKGAQPR
jgi:uncharacterized protein YdaU (DUF1376 family)